MNIVGWTVQQGDNMHKPVRTESRNCFGLAWFGTEAEADAYAAAVQARGKTINGGMMHGQSCGRATCYDYTDQEHGRLYAVRD